MHCDVELLIVPSNPIAGVTKSSELVLAPYFQCRHVAAAIHALGKEFVGSAESHPETDYS